MIRERLLASSSAIVLASLLAHDGAERAKLAGRDLGFMVRAELDGERLLAAVRPAALEEPAL